MRTLRQERNGLLKVLVGVSISRAIYEALLLASERKRVVTFTHREVLVRVGPNSKPHLLLRDWRRALAGYIEKQVGPYPNAVLSDKEKRSDASIAAQSGGYQVRRSEIKAALESPRVGTHSISL
ncbi:MAG: hypothetical protein NT108_01455 [Candidatus Kaiserbacteria bacterium]|nr:hypothetical protein [Candidatus Kaiserbacteria bacterium]